MEEWFYSDDPLIEDMNTLTTKSKPLDDIGKAIYKRFNDWENVIQSG